MAEASGKIAPVGPLLEHVSQLAMAVGLADAGEGSGRVDRGAAGSAAMAARASWEAVTSMPRSAMRALARGHGFTVQTREQFSANERQVISDMSTG